MENKIYEVISPNNYIYLDELDNVIYTSDFDTILGKVDSTYRFIPKSSVVLEQGLTPKMLEAISSIIRKKAGIGEKKAEPIETDNE